MDDLDYKFACIGTATSTAASCLGGGNQTDIYISTAPCMQSIITYDTYIQS